jgi:hypothetical protein
MTQKQLKAIKDASAVASAIWKSKKHKTTEKQAHRLRLATIELCKMFIKHKIKATKSQKDLMNFVMYCVKYPELRFWQALRGWSKYNFILGSSHWDSDMFSEKWIKKHDIGTKDVFEIDDTFHLN